MYLCSYEIQFISGAECQIQLHRIITLGVEAKVSSYSAALLFVGVDFVQWDFVQCSLYVVSSSFKLD